MRNLTVAVAVALAVAVGTAFASDTARNEAEPNGSDKTAVCERLKLRGAGPQQLAQSVCCSQDGGVCGCQYGSIVCCNGQYSTCAC